MIKRVKDQMMRANRLIDDFDGKRDAWQNSKVMECYNELRGVDAKLRELIRKFSTAKLYLMTSHYRP